MTAYLVILFLVWYKKNDFSLIHAHNTYEIAQRVKGYTWENCVKKEIEVYKSL